MSETCVVAEELSSDLSSSVGYRPYTTQFDVIATAADLNAHLGHPGPYDQSQLEQAWQELQSGLVPWRTKLHLLASEADARIRARLSADERASTIVSLLFDQSGSMRGQKMLFAARQLTSRESSSSRWAFAARFWGLRRFAGWAVSHAAGGIGGLDALVSRDA